MLHWFVTEQVGTLKTVKPGGELVCVLLKISESNLGINRRSITESSGFFFEGGGKNNQE